LAGNEMFEPGAASSWGLSRDQSHLQRARGLDLDNPESIHGTKDGRKSKPTSPLNYHGARWSWRCANPVVEEREGGTRGATYHCACTTSLDYPTCNFERVDVVGVGDRERLAERCRSFAPRVTVESSPHDETRQTYDECLEQHDDDDVHDKIAPKRGRVRGVHAVAMVRKVSNNFCDGIEEIESDECEYREPHPRTEAPVEDP
jgi:hypothetical protein